MKKKLAFTLAETMIVIVVLGIIATLTIPALVNKNKESVAKTKVRKAMAAYESALNKMIIENDLKDNGPLTTWAGNAGNGCSNSTQYFKKTKDINGCIFKTSDGIWWNISDIERPLIAFKQDDLTTEKANAANDYSAFVLVGRFGNDGSLRVDDLAYETGAGHAESNSDKQVTKLYNFLSGKTSASEEESCNYVDIICQYKIGKTLPECMNDMKSCVNCNSYYNSNKCDMYDEQGNNVGYYLKNSNGFISYEYIKNFDGGYTTTAWSIIDNKRIKSMEDTYYTDGSYIGLRWSSDSMGNFYKSYENITNSDGSKTINEWRVDSKNNIFKSREVFTNTDGSEISNSWDLNENDIVYKTSESVRNTDGSSTSNSWQYINGNIYKTFESQRNADGSGTDIYWAIDDNNNQYKEEIDTYRADGSYCGIAYDVDNNVIGTDGDCY